MKDRYHQFDMINVSPKTPFGRQIIEDWLDILATQELARNYEEDPYGEMLNDSINIATASVWHELRQLDYVNKSLVLSSTYSDWFREVVQYDMSLKLYLMKHGNQTMPPESLNKYKYIISNYSFPYGEVILLRSVTPVTLSAVADAL